MPKGISEIPILRLETLQKFMTKFTTAPEVILQNMFPSTTSPSSTIKWESMEGGRGLSQFKAPGSPTPKTSPKGIAQHSAEAAFWGEKMYFDEEFLNNLRKEGQPDVYLPAAQRLARELAGITYRAVRRKEWMFAKMLFSNGFSYQTEKGYKSGVNYQVPDAHKVTLGADYKWNTGVKKDIIGDIIQSKRVISDACGALPTVAICNSVVLEYLAKDTTIQTLLQKSAFGSGDLFKGNVNGIVGVNPAVLGSMLNIDNIIIYDELYEVRANITGVVTGGSTTVIPIDEIQDFEAGQSVTFVNAATGTYDVRSIASVQAEASTVTVSVAPTASYVAGRDYILVRQRFVPDTLFFMFAPRVEGQSIAEFKQAPYGLNRHYGLTPDRKETWDPDGIFIRVQDKGIPILFQRDAVYSLTVA